MDYLLDTHTLVWALTGSHRLSKPASLVIANSKNIIYVSSISLYEISLKYHLGKWPEASTIVQNASQLLSKMQFESLSISNAHALHAATLSLNHKDPFDRILAAQATIEGLIVISVDKELIKFGVNLLW